MAATVFNQARAWSKKLSSGKIVYVWEENTHCIKDGPKCAEWCAMKFGDKNAILDRIYRLAQSIPGGMLKVGKKSPDKFVADMIKLLENPLHLHVDTIEIENTSKKFYSSIVDDNRDAVHELMLSIGRADLAELVGTGTQPGQDKFTLDLDKDYEALDALLNRVRYKEEFFGHTLGIPAWRVFHLFDPVGFYSGNAPKEVVIDKSLKCKPLLKIYQSNINIAFPGYSDPEYFNIVTLDDKIIFGGRNDYELEGKLIEIAGDIHMQNGTYVLGDMLKAMYVAEAAPVPLPNDLVMTFRMCKPSKWIGSRFDEMTVAVTGSACESFSVKIVDFVDRREELKVREFLSALTSGYIKLTVDLPSATQVSLPSAQKSLFEA